MDTIWFQEALGRAGSTQADLARHLGLPPSAISRMVSGARQMKLQEAVEVAVFLGVSQDEVLRRAGAEGTPPAASSGRRGRPPRVGVPIPMLRRDTNTIPIRGVMRAADGERMVLEDDPAGTTPRPANLAEVRGAYALYVSGDEMAPRYARGWLLHVNPVKPPTRERDVVVHKQDKTVLVAQFLSASDEILVLRQLNPEKTLRIPLKEVAACHLIVGVDQEG